MKKYILVFIVSLFAFTNVALAATTTTESVLNKDENQVSTEVIKKEDNKPKEGDKAYTLVPIIVIVSLIIGALSVLLAVILVIISLKNKNTNES